MVTVTTAHAVRFAADDALSSAGHIASLIATADRLRRSSALPLRGTNLALLRAEGAPEGSPLKQAAEEVGARVALLNFIHDRSADAGHDAIALARMLGRMYDGIDCDDLDRSIRRQIQSHAGVPVFHGLARDSHPARVIADLWTLCERQAPADRWVVFIGNARPRRARMFAAAARAMGISIFKKAHAPAGADEAAAIADASQPGHWTLWIDGAAVDPDAVQDNHRRIMQAVLIHTLRSA